MPCIYSKCYCLMLMACVECYTGYVFTPNCSSAMATALQLQFFLTTKICCLEGDLTTVPLSFLAFLLETESVNQLQWGGWHAEDKV